MTITDVAGNGATTNTKIPVIQSRDENAGSFTNNLSSNPAFSGGVTTATTSIGLTLNDEVMTFNGVVLQTTLDSVQPSSTLTLSDRIANASNFGYFPITGSWALPVTVGTENDFVVNIYIYGDTI